MSKNTPVPAFLQSTKIIREQTARVAGVEAVKFFRGNFLKEGFVDNSFIPWPKSSSPFAGKRNLYKSGNLFRSIKKTVDTINKVVVIAEAEYADIHNNGGTIVVTEKMKRYFWAKYYELGETGAKAEYCLGMALKEVGTPIKIPKRKFMGNSRVLMNKLEQLNISITKKEMQKAFTSIKI